MKRKRSVVTSGPRSRDPYAGTPRLGLRAPRTRPANAVAAGRAEPAANRTGDPTANRTGDPTAGRATGA
ncbi:MAG TPA: hypothetical protein VN800_02195, partial [Candidatus Acidoferrales bacterium]|nr:hypothetical protein [Candidatus Acidoferrales bacterium]